jgi:thiopeptide-type bacteriocin biosynthesis protein
MGDGGGSNWLYYRIYLGAATTKSEHLITGPFQQISRLDGVRQWFFLRHTDEGGQHLRLRVEASADRETLRRQVEPILNHALTLLPGLPDATYRPTVTPPGGDQSTVQPGHSNLVRVEADEYRPDVEIFGASGVVVAEHLFCASSEAAVRILMDERDQLYSRKSLIPQLMDATTQAFLPGSAREVWADYADYWLCLMPALRERWQPKFAEKAAQLRAQRISVLASDADLGEGAVAVLRTWRAVTSASARAFASLPDRPAVRDLLFHFLHTMNNRLGVNPLEEAYYSTLLAENIGNEVTVGDVAPTA